MPDLSTINWCTVSGEVAVSVLLHHRPWRCALFSCCTDVMLTFIPTSYPAKRLILFTFDRWNLRGINLRLCKSLQGSLDVIYLYNLRGSRVSTRHSGVNVKSSSFPSYRMIYSLDLSCSTCASHLQSRTLDMTAAPDGLGVSCLRIQKGQKLFFEPTFSSFWWTCLPSVVMNIKDSEFFLLAPMHLGSIFIFFKHRYWSSGNVFGGENDCSQPQLTVLLTLH